jgi:tRNA (guanosine-2'-O-)-methyltransferase
MPAPVRLERLAECAARRMVGVVIVLENIEDLGNRAAILRTTEALGFLRVHEVGAPPSHAAGTARSIMNGGEKFLELQRWPDFAACAAGLRAAGVARILAALPPDDRGDHRDSNTDAIDASGSDDGDDTAAPSASSSSSKARGQALHSQRLDNVDFLHDTALVFGNERFGVSAEAIDLVDGGFHVPMFGRLTPALCLDPASSHTVIGSLHDRAVRVVQCQRHSRHRPCRGT